MKKLPFMSLVFLSIATYAADTTEVKSLDLLGEDYDINIDDLNASSEPLFTPLRPSPVPFQGDPVKKFAQNNIAPAWLVVRAFEDSRNGSGIIEKIDLVSDEKKYKTYASIILQYASPAAQHVKCEKTGVNELNSPELAAQYLRLLENKLGITETLELSKEEAFWDESAVIKTLDVVITVDDTKQD